MVLPAFPKCNFVYCMETQNYFLEPWAYTKDNFKGWEWFYGGGRENGLDQNWKRSCVLNCKTNGKFSYRFDYQGFLWIVLSYYYFIYILYPFTSYYGFNYTFLVIDNIFISAFAQNASNYMT